MTKHFQNEIERLKKKILFLAALVEESLRGAVKSITEDDINLADKIVKSDQEIDSLEVEVEEECLKILALHQPVAADLRYVIAVLKINNDLERIADLAANIAKRTPTLSRRRDSVIIPFDLTSMLDHVLSMVRESVTALVTNDVAKANQVCIDDDVVDTQHSEAFHIIRDHLHTNPDAIDYLLSLLNVSRNLERIADHATNIAEDVIYMIEGDIVRHRENNE